jgi:pyruvate kinase
MRRQRRTKIVATLGPASSDRAVIAALFRAGADVFRINMSHTTHDRMRELVRTIRDIEQEFGRSAFWSTCKAPSCGLGRSRMTPFNSSPGPNLSWTPILRPAT